MSEERLLVVGSVQGEPLGGKLSDGDWTDQDVVNLIGGSSHKTLKSTLCESV